MGDVMRHIAIVAALGIMLTVSGCAKYWLEGLTLPNKAPAQATITASVLSPAMANMPNVGQVEKVLGVSFSGSNWEQAIEHFDANMAKLGFTDETKSMLDIMKAAGSEMRGEAILKATRMYSNITSPYVVIIFDNSAIFADNAGNQNLSFPGLGSGVGSFTMCVVKKK